MYIQRKQDLSIFYWLQDDVFKDVNFITFVDDFPATDLVIPTVSVEAKELNLVPFELGNRHGLTDRVWFIDIFGANKSQRDEFGFRILERIEENIPVYDYDEAFPPAVTPTKIGVLIPRKIKMQWVRVIPELVSELYWRSVISFEAEYQSVT